METRERILTESSNLFRRRGIRSVTMDDIARELGISKKTIYQYFNNKADIVHEVTMVHFDAERCMSDEILEKAKDPIEAMLTILQTMAKTFHEIPSTMIYEVQKYYPRSWALFAEFKNQYVFESLRQNLQLGVDLGLYRKDMDIELVAKLRIEEMDTPFNPDKFPASEYDISTVTMEQFKMFIHGLVTLKGKKLIYNYLNQPEDE